jgi:type IV pilus assembly protein PilC
MGKFAESYWWVIIIAAAALVGIFSRLLKTTGGKKAVDDASLKFPAIAPIVRNVNSAYTLRNLSALVGAGVSLPRALVITADTVSNGNYARALLAVEARVKKGEKFSEAIKNFGNLYPPTMIQMIAVGEETGETSNILIKLAEFYENEVDEQTKNFAAVVEPLLMIVIGAAVGFFAVSMVQPMYSMMDAI